MYRPVLLLLSCGWAGIALVTSVSLHGEWQNYKEKFGKLYTGDEETLRFAIWEKHHALISQHNEEFHRGLHRYKLGINAHSDKHLHELKNGGFLGHRTRDFINDPGHDRQGHRYDRQGHRVASAPLPPSVDWRQKGCVGQVRNQGAMGSSSELAALGSLEDVSCVPRGHFVELSQQDMTDCCNLTQAATPVDYIQCICKDGGIDTEASYPTTGEKGPCRFDPAHVGATCKGVGQIAPGNETALQEVVATSGPVAVVVDASHTSFQLYKSGVYNEPSCSTGQLDHAMVVVGYGTTGGEDYWIVQNSWGTSWGMGGYILMSRNKGNQCGIASLAAYPQM